MRSNRLPARMFALKLQYIIIAVFFVVTAQICAADVLASSSFDSNLDSWSATFHDIYGTVDPKGALAWQTSGYLSATSSVPFGNINLFAPSQFLSALGFAYGGALEFQSRTAEATELFVLITNSFDPSFGVMFHGLQNATDSVNGNETPWINNYVPLWLDPSYPDLQQWSKLGGGAVDSNYFEETLASATSLVIRTYSYFPADEQVQIDNVTISSVPDPPSATLVLSSLSLLAIAIRRTLHLRADQRADSQRWNYRVSAGANAVRNGRQSRRGA